MSAFRATRAGPGRMIRFMGLAERLRSGASRTLPLGIGVGLVGDEFSFAGPAR